MMEDTNPSPKARPPDASDSLNVAPARPPAEMGPAALLVSDLLAAINSIGVDAKEEYGRLLNTARKQAAEVVVAIAVREQELRAPRLLNAVGAHLRSLGARAPGHPAISL